MPHRNISQPLKIITGANKHSLIRKDINNYLQQLLAPESIKLFAFGMGTPSQEMPIFHSTVNAADSEAGRNPPVIVHGGCCWGRGVIQGEKCCVWTASSDAKLLSGAAKSMKMYRVFFSF